MLPQQEISFPGLLSTLAFHYGTMFGLIFVAEGRVWGEDRQLPKGTSSGLIVENEMRVDVGFCF